MNIKRATSLEGKFAQIIFGLRNPLGVNVGRSLCERLVLTLSFDRSQRDDRRFNNLLSVVGSPSVLEHEATHQSGRSAAMCARD